MQKMIKKLISAIGRDKLIKAAVFMGIIGMILILFCDSSPKPPESVETAAFTEETEQYRRDTEQQLKEVLSAIKGVGKAEVMLTVSATEEYIYAEETDVSFDDGRTDEKVRYTVIDGKECDEALVRKVIVPQISGVVIVCEGGGNSKTCEAVYRSVSTALGIPVSKIYVAKMK